MSDKIKYIGESRRGLSYSEGFYRKYHDRILRGEDIDLDKLAREMQYNRALEDPSTAAFPSFIVSTVFPAYWGKGTTVSDALRDAKFIRPGDHVRVFRCWPDAYIGDDGNLHTGDICPYAIDIGVGKVNSQYEVAGKAA